MKTTRIWSPFVFLFSALLLTIGAYAEPENLDSVRRKIEAYHDSGEYQHEVNNIIHRAIVFINTKAKQNQLSQHPKRLAIVLDIDETSLSNYAFMAPRKFVGSKAEWHQDIVNAKAPAIAPTLKLYKDAIRHKVAVFFVTGRYTSEQKETITNLHRAGYDQWAGIYFKPTNYHAKSVIPFKAGARKTITEHGYTIIATIGDQFSDLKGGYADARFKLPNPFYYLP